MQTKIRLSSLMVLLMLCCGLSLQAQDTSSSKVVIKTTYEDADGKKHSETKELMGEAAKAFDAVEYSKKLEEKGYKILTMDISKEVKMKDKKMKGKLHEEPENQEDHDVKIIKKKEKVMKSNQNMMIRKMKDSDSETYKIEEKDGKVYINGKVADGKQKRIKIIQSGDGESEMKVEVKDGKVFINGVEVEEIEETDGGIEKHVIIKKSGEGSGANIWMSDDNELIELDGLEGEMIFISEDEDERPRLGIMIEDGKKVNGAAIVDAVEDSPAAKAGLKKGDVVTAINETNVYGTSSLMAAMEEFEAGDEVKVTYVREGKTMTSTIKLENVPNKMLKNIEKKVIIKKEDKQ